MKRVAALFLPQWPIDRLRQAGRTAAPPPEPAPLPPSPDLAAIMADERARACSVPRGGGWRPGARWAREPEGAPAFRAMRPDEGGRALPLPDPAPRPPAIPATATPVVTALRQGNRQVVAAACPAALALGVAPGMTLAGARARLAGLEVHEAEPQADAAALRALAVALARRFSPRVAVEGADTLLLDLAGTAHLFGGEAAMLARLLRFVARLGHRGQAAVADTPGAAWALSREAAGAALACPPGRHAEALAPLPVAALRIAPRERELLQRLGVGTIGELAALPRAPLARRLAGALERLDQATGRLPEPLDPVVPPETVLVREDHADPLASAEGIAAALARLVPRLCAALAAQGLGARRIELVADRVDGVPQRLVVGLARPSRDPAHLLRLMVRRIEEIAPGFGIDALALHLRRAEPLGPGQVGGAGGEAPPPDLAPLVDSIVNRIGAGRLWRARPVESDVPERSVAPAPPLVPPAATGPRLREDDVRRLDRASPPHPWHPRWPRPFRLLPRPERLGETMALMPDHAPAQFTWRGTRHRVVRADGPERIHGEWWRRTGETHAVRDYFRVEDEAGRRFWIFRRGDGERSVTGDLSWWMHGWFW